MSRQIYLLRHTPAQIAANHCYGASDIPSEPAGLHNALPWLHAQLPIEACFVVSPLRRCAALAQALNAQAPTRQLYFEPRFTERDCGVWEGQNWDQISPDEVNAWGSDFSHYAAPRAESVQQLQARVLSGFAAAQELAGSRKLVIVSHAGPIQILCAQLRGTALQTEASIPPGGLVVADCVDGAWQLEASRLDGKNSSRWGRFSL